MHLLNLPNEILSSLPSFFNNIETFTNAAATCRRLRDNFNAASPRTILQLAAASAPTFFSPHPHFLVAATARQASDWALGDETRTDRLKEAFKDGIEGLYNFIIEDDDLNAGLSLDDIRRLYLSRFSIINPFADKIDKMAGDQWYASADNFWDGGVSEPVTLHTESSRAAYQIIIYGELFGRSMDNFLNYTANRREGERQEDLRFHCFDLDTRLDYIKYCIPDWICRSYGGLTVLPRGPYTPGHGQLPEDQISLEHILKCRRWRRMWVSAMKSLAGPEASIVAGEALVTDNAVYHPGQPWHERLYYNALCTAGLEGMQLVTLPPEKIPQAYRVQLIRMKARIDRLTSEPNMQRIGERSPLPVMEYAPDFGREVYVCMRSYWPGV